MRRSLAACVLALAALALPPAPALEQVWEDPQALKERLTYEQLEQVLGDLGSGGYVARKLAAEKLVALADARALGRLTELSLNADDPEVRARARLLLPEIQRRLSGGTPGYIKDFQILGPFPMSDEERQKFEAADGKGSLYIPTGLDGVESLDLQAEVPLRPGQAAGGRKLKWRRPFPGQTGEVDLAACCAEQREYAHAFLLTFVRSEKPAKLRFLLGSDDGVALWVNGRCVLYNDCRRALTKDSDEVTVELKKGWNPVLLRVSQGQGMWGVSLRVVDNRGKSWPVQKIDPACAGDKTPLIPAPNEPAEDEKAALAPRPGPGPQQPDERETDQPPLRQRGVFRAGFRVKQGVQILNQEGE